MRHTNIALLARFSLAPSVAILLATSAAHASEVPDASETSTAIEDSSDVRGSHLSATWVTAPIAVVTSMGGDGALGEASVGLIEIGPRVEYEARLAEVLGFGLSVAYRLALNGDDEAVYGHFVEVPGHVRVAIPASNRFELGIVGTVGFTHGWLVTQGAMQVDGGGPLRVAGATFGPKLIGAVRWTDSLDVLAGAGVTWRTAQVLNGMGYLADSAIVAMSVPVDLGIRARF